MVGGGGKIGREVTCIAEEVIVWEVLGVAGLHIGCSVVIKD